MVSDAMLIIPAVARARAALSSPKGAARCAAPRARGASPRSGGGSRTPRCRRRPRAGRRRARAGCCRSPPAGRVVGWQLFHCSWLLSMARPLRGACGVAEARKCVFALVAEPISCCATSPGTAPPGSTRRLRGSSPRSSIRSDWTARPRRTGGRRCRRSASRSSAPTSSPSRS